MSEFHVQVVRVGEIVKHSNADTLSITKIADYPVIIRTHEFHTGDLAVYVPVDSVVPATDARWEFLGEHRRVRAKRLRGVFSMGLLTACPTGLKEGDDAAAVLGITKYEPPEPLQMGGDNEKCPFEFPVYTDIEGLRRHPDVLSPGEEIVMTEKIHGANGRAVFRDDRLWVGSHTGVKKPDPSNLWWKVALQYDLETKLRVVPNIVIYWEVFGQVQDLKYGVAGTAIALFDALDLTTRRYYDYDEFRALATKLNLAVCPELYRGPWDTALTAHAEGTTVIGNGTNVREGFVVKPIKERYDERVGRCVLKMPGQGYLLRKGG